MNPTLRTAEKKYLCRIFRSPQRARIRAAGGHAFAVNAQEKDCSQNDAFGFGDNYRHIKDLHVDLSDKFGLMVSKTLGG